MDENNLPVFGKVYGVIRDGRKPKKGVYAGSNGRHHTILIREGKKPKAYSFHIAPPEFAGWTAYKLEGSTLTLPARARKIRVPEKESALAEKLLKERGL